VVTFEHFLAFLANLVALGTQAIAVLLIAYGGVLAIGSTVWHSTRGARLGGLRRDVFVRFGVWLALGLQYALAADIVISIVAPTWDDIGKLGAIAVIRTFLGYFLSRDMAEAEQIPVQTPSKPAGS
jgi:uncharacterized membrane protein